MDGLASLKANYKKVNVIVKWWQIPSTHIKLHEIQVHRRAKLFTVAFRGPPTTYKTYFISYYFILLLFLYVPDYLIWLFVSILPI